MTTESPVRFVGNAGLRKWPANEEGMVSASGNMAGQELGMLLKEHRFHGNWKDAVPSRSGSAPPSMEGSFAALGNLTGHHQTGLDGILSSSSNSELLAQEEQIRADPSYVAYYINNVNLNPRLPPPITSRENRHLAQHVSLSGDNRRLASFDDNNMGSLLPSRTSLSTHKEESEEDQSPTWVSSGNVGTNVGDLSGQLPSSSRNKSLVDLIQEDFPRTPSPVFSNQSRLSSHGPTEDVADSEARVSPLQDSSVAMNKLPESGVCGSNSTPAKHSAELIRNAELSERPSSSSETISGHHVGPNGEVNTNSGVPSVGSIDTELKRLSISKDNRTQHSKQPPPDNGLLPWGSTSQVQAAQSHGVHNPYNTVDQFPHGQPKPSPVDMKSVFQTAGITSPFYGTTTGYLTSVNPFFPNTQQPSIITPQYNLCGYAVNAPVLPSCVAGYSLPSATPMTLESPPSLNFNGTAGNVIPGVDLQHLYKFYGQLGMAVQSPFSDSLYIPYFQHPSAEAFGVTHQYDPASRSYDAQKGISSSAFSPEQRPQYVRGGNLNIPSPLKVGVSSPSYYGSPPNMGVLMQYPGSPLANLQLPGSPVASPTLSVRRNDNIRSPASSIRNTGAYSGWQGSRGRERIDDPKTYSYLEELKSNKARRFELSDVTGHIVEFSTDQHGSRFIQQKLETSTIDEKASVFKEVLPHASTLMTDVFGNYVIQKFFEHGSADQRKELANQLVGHILPLSLQMYGCRVIQKALEVIELDQKTLLVIELDGHVMRCVRDQNGNHVIQKCIECVPTDRIEFIISAFRGQVATLSTHPYGCRVIQRVLEHCTDELQTQCIVDEILQSACLLAQDQYGNYVTQHVLERGKPHERSQIISKLAGQIVLMSQHKFASNVIEKCLEYGDAAQRGLLIEEIVGQTEGNDDLLMMMKDQFANYVIQKILETCTDKQRAVLLSRIRIHLSALKKYTYGKHIVARVEQLSGEETST